MRDIKSDIYFILACNLIFYYVPDYREVFKARDKKNIKKFVAMKKVLMDNEKEGVSLYHD